MTTENNFTATAETLKENVAKGMKWMQDANAKFVETQKQQMKTATDMFNKTFATSQVGGNNNLNDSFGAGSKAIVDLFQKNIETVTNLFKTSFKPADLAKFTDKDAFAKEINKQIETLNQQIADLTIVNQNNVDLILKQVEATTKSFTPLNEQFKKELEKTAESTKETFQTIVESYTNFAAPSMEANKETFEKINEQIKASVQTNVKFWSNLFNTFAATATKAATEAKVENPLLKITTGTASKKQTATSMN